MAKEYTIISVHHGREHKYTGTMEYLLNEVFGYTLECGHSWEGQTGCLKVNMNPKTGASLVTALNNAAHNCNHYYDYYELG